MDYFRRDPVTFSAISLLVAGAVVALLGGPRHRSRALTWAAVGLGAVGLLVIAVEFWAGMHSR
jgi:hypothetical protein